MQERTRSKGRDGEAGGWRGQSLVAGAAAGRLIWSDVPLSFWGGVNPATAQVIDRHHPLFGVDIAGAILAIPGSRGSCTGSAVLLELLLSDKAPAALVVAQSETVLPLGVFVAEALFGKSIPVLSVAPHVLHALRGAGAARVYGAGIEVAADEASLASTSLPPVVGEGFTPEAATHPGAGIALSPGDRAMLAGAEGQAAALAMGIVLRMAQLMGADRLISVSQAHIDGCIYTGPASLRFAERLRDLDARVRVPTTLNAISADERRWRALGVPESAAHPALALAHAYVAMGAAPSYTCAPYQLPRAPQRGEHIAWAESNAVAYANSVIGARTAKYPDFLDACIAIVGRAPLAGCHQDDGRRARVLIAVDAPGNHDDALWPLLGHLAGELAPDDIPVITGLERLYPSTDDLRAFAAAFATTSNAAMFHIAGVTPEAPDVAAATGGVAVLRCHRISRAELARAWCDLGGMAGGRVDCVSLGNPHFSIGECRQLAALTRGRKRRPEVPMLIALGRHTLAEATESGLAAELDRFGAAFINDTCWCMIGEPVIPPEALVILTNSAKYAHYGPGLVGRAFRFGALAACVEAACTGTLPAGLPRWLADAPESSGASG